MPTFDSGRCFLTVLLPIKTTEVVETDGMRNSPVHMVRDALAVLPTARQSQVTVEAAKISPFVRNRHTHFARFVVIEDVVYNGRMPTDAILDQSDRTVGRPIDQLPCPYLLFTADFDAPNGTQQELRAWLESVWTAMRDDLAPVFTHCYGYAAAAGTASGFADYIIGCQVETTMPFNDYWPGKPPLAAISIPLLAGAGLVTAGIVGTALSTLVALIGWATSPWPYVLQGLCVGAVALGAGAYVAYLLVMWHGAKPFPMAPYSDLPSVLKALYLQRQVIRFAIDMQGKDDQALYDGFGDFIRQHQPHDTANPSTTQAPGIIPV